MENYCSLLLSSVLIISALVTNIKADTPANCTYEDVIGSWMLYEGSKGNEKTIDCSSFS